MTLSLSWKEILRTKHSTDEKAAFLNKAVDWLLANNFTLDELIYDKYRLRNALENKISEAKYLAMKKVHQTLLLNPEDFAVNDRSQVVFEQGRYGYDSIYCGFRELPEAFFRKLAI